MYSSGYAHRLTHHAAHGPCQNTPCCNVSKALQLLLQQLVDISLDLGCIVLLVVEGHGAALLVDDELVEVPYKVLAGANAATAALVRRQVALQPPARGCR